MGADLFSIGRSSLNTSKKALSTTSHNIANANTEGFSRQRVVSATNNPVGTGKHVFGTGVHIKSVKRVHDNLIEKKVHNSITADQFNKERSFQLGRVEEIFNEINSDGMNKIMNRFFNSFRELSTQPENEVVRALVRDNANIVVKDFNRISESITNVKDDIDTKIAASVADLNNSAEIIASLNKEIVNLENQGGETGDLRDQRDAQVRLIAESFKVNTYEDKRGQYVVNIIGVGSLVAGGIVNTLQSGTHIGDGPGSYPDEGKMDIFFENKRTHSITRNLKQGKLGAMIKTRNEEVTNMRASLDSVSHGLIHTTNAIHRRGFTNREIPLSKSGVPLERMDGKPITGVNFFKEPMDKVRSAEYISLSDEILGDLNNISTGLEPNSPGDNRIAIAISKLQHEKVLGEGTTTFEEAYLTSVGKIGLATAKAKINTEQSSGILAQAKSIKERLSGVSLDEETANMIRYQHSYDASARMIKAADEMFDTVLQMMR